MQPTHINIKELLVIMSKLLEADAQGGIETQQTPQDAATPNIVNSIIRERGEASMEAIKFFARIEGVSYSQLLTEYIDKKHAEQNQR